MAGSDGSTTDIASFTTPSSNDDSVTSSVLASGTSSCFDTLSYTDAPLSFYTNIRQR